MGVARVLHISNHASYCWHVQNVTFHPPPFDLGATFSERYRAYVREDGKVLDKRQIEDRSEEDDHEEEHEVARVNAGLAQYRSLYSKQQDILSDGSYVACCISALAKFNPIEEAKILGYTSDERELVELHERTANHVRACYPEALLGFIAPMAIKVAEEHIVNSLRVIAIAGTPVFDLVISGMIKDPEPTSYILGLKDLSRLPPPVREKAFESLTFLELQLASEDATGSHRGTTVDWSASLGLLIESPTSLNMITVHCPHLSHHDPGGYWSFHGLFSHGTLPSLGYLSLEGAKIRAKDFCAFLGRHQKLESLTLANTMLTGPDSGLWRGVYYAIHDVQTLLDVMIVRPLENSTLHLDSNPYSNPLDRTKHSVEEAKLLDFLLRRGPWCEAVFEAFCY